MTTRDTAVTGVLQPPDDKGANDDPAHTGTTHHTTNRA
jgi:hypothetical protein